MPTVHIGLLGAGNIAADHARSLRLNPLVGKLSVFDVDPARAGQFAQTHQAELAATEAELIDRCDLVWICTPPAFHAAAVTKASAAGKPVFCEKPLAITEKDLAAIERAVAKSGQPFFMGQSGRYSDPFRKMQKLAAEGALGELTQVWSIRQNFPDRQRHPAWRFDDATCGGVVTEIGVHEIDFVRWVGGDYCEIFAAGSDKTIAPGKFTDTVAAVARLASGAMGRLDLSWAEPRYLWQRGIRGTEGSLFIDDMHFTTIELRRPGRPEPELIPAESWKHPETGENMALREQAAAVLTAFVEHAPYAVTAADGAAAVRAALAIRRSIKTGRPVRIGPEGRR